MQVGKVESRIGDLISIAPAPPVVSLTDLEQLRGELGDRSTPPEIRDLLAGYCLSDSETRASFDTMISGLAREGELGDAFHVQGVYGAGKSHLLAVLTLLAGHPEQAWPVFLEGHPGYTELAGGFTKPRLVVAVALDEYPTKTHPLEYVVLSRIEQELAVRHGVRAALTEESHLLELVARYVMPQAGEALNGAAIRAGGVAWSELCQRDPKQAAAVALDFIADTGFPLDWRRSRTEAWAELQRTLRAANLDGLVVLLDELGLFLAGKDRAGLNADASFLQWLAQRTATARGWLICSTQRGIEEAGDIDRRTLRQLRDRFRTGFTLDLAELEWVVRHRVVRRLDEARFTNEMERLAGGLRAAGDEAFFSAGELGASYPINPLCLQAIRRAAERSLSRTRSVVRLLQEAAHRGNWPELPVERLITPEAAFDLLHPEMTMSAAGRKHLHAYDVVMSNADRIARGQEEELAVVMKSLCLLGLGEVRWSERELRASLVGCAHPNLWVEEGRLRGLLQALYQRGSYVERLRREPEEGDEYFIDVASDSTERLRQRLGELLAQLGLEEARVTRAALEAGREAAFPIAALAEEKKLSVYWLNARRFVVAVCCDLRGISDADLSNHVGRLASHLTAEDACLFLASPTAAPEAQEAAWLKAAAKVEGRFSAGLVVWLPAALSDLARERLREHAALSLMVGDKTLFRRGESEFRAKVRERWAASEEEVRRLLQRAYYEGKVIGADGREALARERLWGLFGDWEGTLAEVFAGPFRALFPRFPEVAPQQRLVGRVHTNQIIDQFIRPGEVLLPPASALEAHLCAYAAPLGLVEGEGRHLRLGLKNSELVQTAIAETPASTGAQELDPHETIALNELTGRLAKSEWGLTREQGELLIAAVIKTGHLVGLDAFLLPVRLEQVAAPLGDSLPYVMRGHCLEGQLAQAVAELWEAAYGLSEEWSLPTQERAWGFLIQWATELRERGAEWREAITSAAVQLEHHPEQWDWAREALGVSEALAQAVDSSHSSKDGLTLLAMAAERLPGGYQQTRKRLSAWYSCERFLNTELATVAKLRRLVSQAAAAAATDGLLARERQVVLEQIGRAERVVLAAEEVKAAAVRWLENYRRHYLAWHEGVYATSRFEPLAQVRRSVETETARRLARAGLATEEAAALETELAKALERRCLAGDPLPEGHTICPSCGLGFKEQVEMPVAEALQKQAEVILAKQWEELVANHEMLARRAVGCGERFIRLTEVHIGQETRSCLTMNELCDLLTDDVIVWLRQNLSQPRARKRELGELMAKLHGRELTRREVLRIVEEWLGEGEEYVEVV